MGGGEGGVIEKAMRAGWSLLRAPLVFIAPLVSFIQNLDLFAAAA